MRFLVITIALAFLTSTASAQSLEGAWTLVELDVSGGPNPGIRIQTQPSLLIVTPTHYAVMFVSTDAPRTKLSGSPSDSELAEAFRGVVANGGSYELDGSTLTRHTIVALWPGFEGRTLVSEIRLEDDTLWVTDSSRADVTTTAKYERIPPGLDAETPPVIGVWRLAETERSGGAYPGKQTHTEPSLLIITGTHFASMYVGTSHGEEGWMSAQNPRAELGPTPTEADFAGAYQSFVASAGSYELDGSTFKGRTIVTKNPNGMRGAGDLDVRIEANSLSFSRPLADGDGDGYVIRRFERILPGN